MKTLFTWLLVLDVIDIMSWFAYITANNDKGKDLWVGVIGIVTFINLVSVFLALVP